MKMSDVKWFVVTLMLVTAPPASAQSSGAPQGPEGISVTGDWTIAVRDPDGSLVSEHKFRNALVPGEGPDALNKLLGRQYVLDAWSISFGAFGGSGLQQPCIGGAAASPSPCIIGDPRFAAFSDARNSFSNLAITTPTTGPNAGKLVLSGNATVTNPASQSTIEYVFASVSMCPVTYLANSPCGGANVGNSFTSKTLATPVTLRPGQIVQLEVVYAFSSGV